MQEANHAIAINRGEWRNFSSVLPIPACRLSHDALKRLYRIIDGKQQEFRDTVLASLSKAEEETLEQFDARKNNISKHFVTLVTVTSTKNEEITADNEGIFDDKVMPSSVKFILISTENSLRSVFNLVPESRINLYLDFSYPSMFDFSKLPTLATTNASNLKINSNNEQWFSAAKFRLSEFFDEMRTGYDWLHRPAIYDVLLAILGLPIAVWTTVRVTSIFKNIDNLSIIPRMLVYTYVFYLSLLMFRLLFSYARWAFPKIEASSNIEAPQVGHRLLLGGIVLSIVASFTYDLLKTVV